MNVVVSQVGEWELSHRKEDRYVDATRLCKASGKQWAHYAENKGTQEFLAALATSIGIPMDRLTRTVKTGPNESRGTWIHPRVAMHFAQWVSPKFAVAVSGWVLELLTTGKVELNTGTSAREVEQLRADVAQLAANQNALASTLADLPQLLARALGEAATRSRGDAFPLVGTETVASRLGRLLPHWNTTAKQRARIRDRAVGYVRHALGQGPICVHQGSQLEFPPHMHYHLDTAIMQAYREACRRNEVDDYGLYRDCDQLA